MVETETQQSVTEWAEATFGHVTNPSVIVDRTKIEIEELLGAVTSGDKVNIGKETADVIILLYRLLEIHGLKVDEVVNAKMAENRSRTGLAKGDGTGSHIKPDARD